MPERPVILFMFAGRRQNLRINLPMIRRILDEHPQVQFHCWNLARNHPDAEFLRTVEGERVEVFRQFYGYHAQRGAASVWRHYADPRFQDHLFVKVDDDVVFIQTEHFGEFLDAVRPGCVLSAEVVNNGACTQFMPELQRAFTELGISLLDVHESNRYAQLAHQHMTQNWYQLTVRPTSVVDIDTWLSINFIGLDWAMLDSMNRRIGGRSPMQIADRAWRPGSRVGDEGAANMFPRAVMRGFTVAHLGFGPQMLTAEQEDKWRVEYAEIGQAYLKGVRKPNTTQPVRDTDIQFDVDGVRIGLGIAIQTIDAMVAVEGDPTTALSRLATGLRMASVNIGGPQR